MDIDDSYESPRRHIKKRGIITAIERFEDEVETFEQYHRNTRRQSGRQLRFSSATTSEFDRMKAAYDKYTPLNEDRDQRHDAMQAMKTDVEDIQENMYSFHEYIVADARLSEKAAENALAVVLSYYESLGPARNLNRDVMNALYHKENTNLNRKLIEFQNRHSKDTKVSHDLRNKISANKVDADREIAQLRADVKSREDDIASSVVKSKELHQTIESKKDGANQAMAEKDREIKELCFDIKSRDEKLEELRKAMDEKDREIKELLADVKSRDEKSEELCKAMDEKDRRIAELETTVKSKDDGIASSAVKLQQRCQAMDEKNRRIAELETAVKSKDDEIATKSKELYQTMDEKNREIAELRTAIESRDDDIKASKAEIAGLRTAAKSKADELDDLRQKTKAEADRKDREIAELRTAAKSNDDEKLLLQRQNDELNKTLMEERAISIEKDAEADKISVELGKLQGFLTDYDEEAVRLRDKHDARISELRQRRQAAEDTVAELQENARESWEKRLEAENRMLATASRQLDTILKLQSDLDIANSNAEEDEKEATRVAEYLSEVKAELELQRAEVDRQGAELERRRVEVNNLGIQCTEWSVGNDRLSSDLDAIKARNLKLKESNAVLSTSLASALRDVQIMEAGLFSAREKIRRLEAAVAEGASEMISAINSSSARIGRLESSAREGARKSAASEQNALQTIRSLVGASAPSIDEALRNEIADQITAGWNGRPNLVDTNPPVWDVLVLSPTATEMSATSTFTGLVRLYMAIGQCSGESSDVFLLVSHVTKQASQFCKSFVILAAR